MRRTALPPKLAQRLRRAFATEQKAIERLEDVRSFIADELREVQEQGYSLRAIAEATGQSHSRVHVLTTHTTTEGK